MERKNGFVIEHQLAAIFAVADDIWTNLKKAGHKGNENDDIAYVIRKSAQLQSYNKSIANKAVSLYENETGDKEKRLNILFEKHFQRAQKVTGK